MSEPLKDLQLGSPDPIETPLTLSSDGTPEMLGEMTLSEEPVELPLVLTKGVPTILDNLTLEFVGTAIEGPQGPPGIQGIDGRPGIDGAPGINGNPGYTPVKGVDYFDGAKGDKGDKGDGITFIFVENEIPLGAVDGVNCVFVTKSVPIAGSVKVYSDGLRLNPTIDLENPCDYSINDKEITLLTPPVTALIVDYRVENI